MKNKNYVGTEINGLKIIDYFSNGKRQFFECHCSCGFYFKARADAIKSGSTKSCGCKTSELMSKSHTLEDNLGAINIVFRNYKNTAARKKLSFLLNFIDFKKFIFDNCVYCGSMPKESKFSGSSKANKKDIFINYNGIDRIDNSIGYVKDNCVSCCSICNGAKSDRSFEEFENWIKRLVSFNNDK